MNYYDSYIDVWYPKDEAGEYVYSPPSFDRGFLIMPGRIRNDSVAGTGTVWGVGTLDDVNELYLTDVRGSIEYENDNYVWKFGEFDELDLSTLRNVVEYENIRRVWVEVFGGEVEPQFVREGNMNFRYNNKVGLAGYLYVGDRRFGFDYKEGYFAESLVGKDLVEIDIDGDKVIRFVDDVDDGLMLGFGGKGLA